MDGPLGYLVAADGQMHPVNDPQLMQSVVAAANPGSVARQSSQQQFAPMSPDLVQAVVKAVNPGSVARQPSSDDFVNFLSAALSPNGRARR